MFASLLVVALAVADVERFDVGPQIEVVVAEDHRTPLVWLRVEFDVGAGSPNWWRDDLDVLWPTLALPRVGDDKQLDPRFEAWSASNACGVDALLLHRELEGGLSALAESLFRTYDEPGFRFPNARSVEEWHKEGRTPSGLVEHTLARWFYRHGDPRWIATRPTRMRNVGVVEARERMNGVVDTGMRVYLAGDVSAQEAGWLVHHELRPSYKDRAPLAHPASAVAKLNGAGGEDKLRTARGSLAAIQVLARPGLAYKDPDAAAALLADEVVLRRLNGLLRGTRGDSYIVTSSGLLGHAPQVYTITTTAAPERLAAHSAAVRGMLTAVVDGGIREDEVATARRAWELRQARVRVSPYELMGDWALRRMLAETGAADLGEAIRTVDWQAVDAVARRLYTPDAFSRVRVVPPGYAAAIRKAER